MRHLIFPFALFFSILVWGQSNISNTKIENLNLEELQLSEVFDGERHTLISVGGTWCKPCLMQKPFVASLGQQYPQYLKVVFLFWRDTPEKIISKFGQNNDLDNYFLASHDLINRLNISTYPTHILVDSQGNIIDNDVAINDVGSLIKRPN